MARVSVVVPVYFNAETLTALMERLASVSASIPEDDFEFWFVDDGSGDHSYEILVQLAKMDHRVHVIRLSRNFGSNAAILAGLSYAKGDCAVVISADLQDPPELIPQLLSSWHQGNQVVLAARQTREDPVLSRFFSSIFNRLFRRLVFHDFPANGFDFMLVDRRVVDILVRLSEKNSYIFGQTFWVGFKRHVIYYDRVKREKGRSRWTIAKRIKYFVDAFTAFSYLPLRAASSLGILTAGLGFLYALFIIGMRVTQNIPVPGWASLTVVVLITSGVQLLLIGVLGEYLWRVLDESRRRPPFIVESVVSYDLNTTAVLEGERAVFAGSVRSKSPDVML